GTPSARTSALPYVRTGPLAQGSGWCPGNLWRLLAPADQHGHPQSIGSGAHPARVRGRSAGPHCQRSSCCRSTAIRKHEALWRCVSDRPWADQAGRGGGATRGYRWPYPGAIAFLCLFILYQLYRLSYAYSPGLVLLTFFDSVVVALTWHEYRLRNHHPA